MSDLDKNVYTVVGDVYELLEKGFEVSEENLNLFAENIKTSLRERLKYPCKKNKDGEKFALRMSKLGTPPRRIWFDSRNPSSGDISPSTAIKFLYGDLIEQLILLLVRESGHTVTGEQEALEIDGIQGHQDFEIDGVPMDAKSVSSYGFGKFKDGSLRSNDPFGYIAQISSYSFAKGKTVGGFLAINKESGELAQLMIDKVDMINPRTRIAELKAVIEKDTPPDRHCYEPVEQGKSGNLVLHKNCTYCPHADVCWKNANGGKGLRKFKYSTGVTKFVHVAETPRVEEIFSPVPEEDAGGE